MAKQKIAVIGAGPVGALAALYAAGRGHDVEVYELRGDLRDPQIVPLNFTKSINLAMSERGINALRNAKVPGLLESIMAETIPMHGRMIHAEDNGDFTEESQQYDIHGRYINAVDRAGLNKRLLDELDKLPNVKLIFDHKLTGADFKKKLAWFEQREDKPRTDHAQNPTQDSSDEPARSKEIEVKFDLMLGCDGAHSAVRYHLMKYTRMNYTQEYIDTLWCEFHIEPSKFTGYDGFRISPNHLHIWPGKEFMFIAIPSLDKSFTCTLFMPATHFATLDEDTSSVPAFFRKNFPGVADRLISSKDLISQYTTNPHLPLITIKCAPHHYGAAAVILGDSAHAMVPFYGQGMNAGLEDVRVLFEHLDSAPNTSESARAGALSAYSTQRTPDASSICDLALRNYREMRADVTSPLYRLRKSIEEKLSIWFPSSGFKTQYSRVSFGNERYSEIERLTQGQWRTLQAGMVGFVGVLASAAGYGIWAWWRWERATRASKGIFKGSVRLAALTERIGRAFT